MFDKIWLNGIKLGIFARQLINHKLLNKKKMKKVFFVFAVAAGIAMTACNNKPAGDAAASNADSIAKAATADSIAKAAAATAAAADTTAKAADTTAAAPAAKK